LRSALGSLYATEVANGDLEDAVTEMLEEDLLMREGDLLLSLPIGFKPRTTTELGKLVGRQAASTTVGKDGTVNQHVGSHAKDMLTVTASYN